MIRMILVLLASAALVLACGPQVKDSADAGEAGGAGGESDTGAGGGATVGGTRVGETGGGPCTAPTDGTSLTDSGVVKDVMLNDCSKTPFRLSEYVCQHDLTVLYFGAGWCQPCREKQPKLKKWFAQCGEKGFGVVVVLAEQDGPGDPATSAFCNGWVEEYSLTFPVLTDPLSKYWKDAAGGETLPVGIFLDQNMNIIGKCLGNECDGMASFIGDVFPGCPIE